MGSSKSWILNGATKRPQLQRSESKDCCCHLNMLNVSEKTLKTFFSFSSCHFSSLVSETLDKEWRYHLPSTSLIKALLKKFDLQNLVDSFPYIAGRCCAFNNI